MIGKVIIFIMEWIWRLLYLNLTWLVFALPIITIIPASAAMFGVVHKWLIEKEVDTPIFSTFYLQFKRNFLRSYPLGLAIILIGSFLLLDMIILWEVTSGIMSLVKYALIMLSFLFFISALFSFPIFIQTRIPWYKTLFFSLMFSVSKPVITLIVLCELLLIFLLFLFATGIGVLLIPSLLALCLTIAVKLGVNSKFSIKQGKTTF